MTHVDEPYNTDTATLDNYKKGYLHRLTLIKFNLVGSNRKWDMIRQFPSEFIDNSFLKKGLIRSGVPDDLRAFVWSNTLGSYELLCRLPSKYCEYVDKAKYVTSTQALHQIELDVTRTFPSHKLYQSCEGVSKLRRVLRAFSVYNPEISYCQALNFLAGLLLTYMEEDLAFWSLVQMVCSSTDKGMNISDYYTEHLFGLKRDIKTLQYLMKRYTSKALALLRAENIELDVICAEWFLCSFATTLPMPVTLRVWDTLLNEGTKVFFRVSLALFKRFEEKTPHPCTFENIVSYFKSELKVQELSPNALTRMAFHGIGTFKRSNIRRLQEIATQEVIEAMQQNAIEKSKRLNRIYMEGNQDIVNIRSQTDSRGIVPLLAFHGDLYTTSTIPSAYRTDNLEDIQNESSFSSSANSE